MQDWKMFTNTENVHTVGRITKAVCRTGRCSQTPKMFTRVTVTRTVCRAGSYVFTNIENVHTVERITIKRYAGLKDVHKRRKCGSTMYSLKIQYLTTTCNNSIILSGKRVVVVVTSTDRWGVNIFTFITYRC